MSSKSKIDANRRNAQKSTGPKTPEGKAASSRNSLVHGLTSNAALLPGEDPADLQELYDQFHDDFQPVGAIEESLLERMAVVTYRLRRLARIEVGYFDARLRFDALPPRYNADGKLDAVA